MRIEPYLLTEISAPSISKKLQYREQSPANDLQKLFSRVKKNL